MSNKRPGFFVGASPGELEARAKLNAAWCSSKNLDSLDVSTEAWRYMLVDLGLRQGKAGGGKAEYELSFTDAQRFAATVYASGTLKQDIVMIASDGAVPFLLVPNEQNLGTLCVNIVVARDLQLQRRTPNCVPANTIDLCAVSTDHALQEILTRLNHHFDEGWRMIGAIALAYGSHNLYYLQRGNERKTLTFNLSTCVASLDFILFGLVSLMLGSASALDRIDQVKQQIQREQPLFVPYSALLKFSALAALVVFGLYQCKS